MAKIERNLFQERAGSHEAARREPPAQPVHERLLGTLRLPIASRSEFDGSRALFRSSGVSARVYPHSRCARRQKPPSTELPGWRHDYFDGSEHTAGATESGAVRF